jgi:hypothetical protein
MNTVHNYLRAHGVRYCSLTNAPHIQASIKSYASGAWLYVRAVYLIEDKEQGGGALVSHNVLLDNTAGKVYSGPALVTDRLDQDWFNTHTSAAKNAEIEQLQGDLSEIEAIKAQATNFTRSYRLENYIHRIKKAKLPTTNILNLKAR